MPTSRDWADAVQSLRQVRDPSRHADLVTLYDLAARDGEDYLRTRFRDIPAGDRRDLVHDVLARALQEIIAAHDPRALFRTCLRNRAISVLRARHGNSADFDEDTLGYLLEPTTDGRAEGRHDLGVVMAVLLDQASPRDVALFVAYAMGEHDIESIAASFDVTTGNAYQIVSRMRKLLRHMLGLGGAP